MLQLASVAGSCVRSRRVGHQQGSRCSLRARRPGRATWESDLVEAATTRARATCTSVTGRAVSSSPRAADARRREPPSPAHCSGDMYRGAPRSAPLRVRKGHRVVMGRASRAERGRLGRRRSDPEVGRGDAPAAVDEHVLGLEVAVHHARVVSAGESARRPRRPAGSPSPSDRAPEASASRSLRRRAPWRCTCVPWTRPRRTPSRCSDGPASPSAAPLEPCARADRPHDREEP